MKFSHDILSFIVYSTFPVEKLLSVKNHVKKEGKY